jgi:hypothetical protein
LFEVEDLLLDIFALEQLQDGILNIIADQFVLRIIECRLYNVAAEHAALEEFFPGHSTLSHVLGIIHF